MSMIFHGFTSDGVRPWATTPANLTRDGNCHRLGTPDTDVIVMHSPKFASTAELQAVESIVVTRRGC
jgi:hypothetical protein